MTRTVLLLSFSLLLLLFSCEKDLSKQMSELQEREKALLEKEKSLQLIEAEYAELKQLRDSLSQVSDTLLIDPRAQEITGKWKGKMVCTESNCLDYAVGDTRVDEWILSSEGNQITAQNVNKSGTIRVYTGSFEGPVLKLLYKSPETQKRPLEIALHFTNIGSQKISGTRNLTLVGNCQSNYTIELTR